MFEATKPNPGSPEALDQGCLCSVLDNGHGRGYHQDSKGEAVFWINAECPLHGSGLDSKRVVRDADSLHSDSAYLCLSANPQTIDSYLQTINLHPAHGSPSDWFWSRHHYDWIFIRQEDGVIVELWGENSNGYAYLLYRRSDRYIAFESL